MTDPNDYIPDLVERFPDNEIEELCECGCQRIPSKCLMNKFDEERDDCQD